MELTFWGVRGTTPIIRKPASVFGGNTPCAALSISGGSLIVVDAGTGFHDLGRRLAAAKRGPVRMSILITHFHLDHLQGLPFFDPLYDSSTEIVFYSAAEPDVLREHLGRLMGNPFFPVAFEATASRKRFRKVGGRRIRIGGAAVSACPLNHPQGCVAYKIEEGGASIVFATDTEHPGEGVDGWLLEFARGASCLIYDATFTPREYEAGKQGWGHSTWREGARLAAAAGVGRLVLSHFNREHADGDIRMIERLARRAFPATGAAREGLRLVF